TGAQCNSVLRAGRCLHRFIETYWRGDLPLQLSVIEHVIIGQRLLKHRQFEFIESLEERQITERVRRIRVAHELNLWKAFTDAPDNIDIPTRLDLDLDALISGG